MSAVGTNITCPDSCSMMNWCLAGESRDVRRNDTRTLSKPTSNGVALNQKNLSCVQATAHLTSNSSLGVQPLRRGPIPEAHPLVLQEKSGTKLLPQIPRLTTFSASTVQDPVLPAWEHIANLRATSHLRIEGQPSYLLRT